MIIKPDKKINMNRFSGKFIKQTVESFLGDLDDNAIYKVEVKVKKLKGRHI